MVFLNSVSFPSYQEIVGVSSLSQLLVHDGLKFEIESKFLTLEHCRGRSYNMLKSTRTGIKYTLR